MPVLVVLPWARLSFLSSPAHRCAAAASSLARRISGAPWLLPSAALRSERQVGRNLSRPARSPFSWERGSGEYLLGSFANTSGWRAYLLWFCLSWRWNDGPAVLAIMDDPSSKSCSCSLVAPCVLPCEFNDA